LRSLLSLRQLTRHICRRKLCLVILALRSPTGYDGHFSVCQCYPDGIGRVIKVDIIFGKHGAHIRYFSFFVISSYKKFGLVIYEQCLFLSFFTKK